MKKIFAGIIVFLGIFLFYLPLFTGQVLFFGDNYNLFAPVKSFAARGMLQGRLPLWNQYLFSGSPFLADLNFGLLSPLNLPFFIFKPLPALTGSTLVGLAFFGFGVYWWLRERKESRETAVLGALVGVCSGTMVSALNNLSIIQTVAFLPVTVAALERGVRKNQVRFFTLAGFFLAAALLGGHPQFVWGLVLTMPLYFFLRFPAQTLQVFKGLALALVLALGLAAVQLLPFYEFSTLAARPQGELAYLVSGSLPKIGLIRLILPWFFGLKNQGTSWAFLSERNMGLASSAGYLGLLALVLVGFQAFHILTDFFKKDRDLRSKLEPLAPVLPALVMLVLTLGPATPLFWGCLKFVPGCDRFRNPEQYLFFWSFWLLPVLAQSFDFFLFKTSRKAAALLALPGLFGLILVIQPEFLIRVLTPVINRYLLAKNPQAEQVIFDLVSRNLLIGSLILLGGVVLRFYKLPLRRYLLASLLLADLVILGRGDLITAPADLVEVKSTCPTVAPESKILSYADATPYADLGTYWNQFAVRPPFGQSKVNSAELESFSVLKKITRSWPVDLNLFCSLPSPDGYGSLVLRSYADWIGSPAAINGVETAFLLEQNRQAKQKRQFWADLRLMKSDGKIELLNKPTLPQQAKDWLIRPVPWYPGWRAAVDGQETPIYLAGGVFQAVKVPPGTHQVTFTFFPVSFKLGALISFLSWGGVIWLWRFGP